MRKWSHNVLAAQKPRLLPSTLALKQNCFPAWPFLMVVNELLLLLPQHQHPLTSRTQLGPFYSPHTPWRATPDSCWWRLPEKDEKSKLGELGWLRDRKLPQRTLNSSRTRGLTTAGLAPGVGKGGP